MHIPHLTLTLSLLTTSSLALSHPASFAAMLKRGSALAKRQGYYPSSDLCNGSGTTCAEICGADTVECPSDGTILSCHSTTDGSHCCTDGTGNACGPGDYCTNDGRGQTYCCPENLNAEECAREFGLDGPLIPDSAETTTVAASTGVPESVVVPTPTETVAPDTTVESVAETETQTETQTETETSAVLVSSTSTTRVSSTRTTEVPSVVLPTIASSSRLPNATSTGPGLPQFTGGAAKIVGAGAVVFAAVAGLVVL